MFFKVTNESKGPRFIVTATGRTLILPGDKNAKTVQMDPEVARQYLALKDRGRGTSFALQAVDDKGRTELQKPIERREPSLLAPDAQKPPKQRPKTPYEEMAGSEAVEENVEVEVDEVNEVNDKTKSKAELLARADDMDIADLRMEAKMLLGKDWPETGDRFGKARIKSLLES